MFSLLPDLTDTQIEAQIKYCITNGFAVSIEWTDDPHPRNCYWEMWGLPLFDIPDVATVMYEINECRKAHPGIYIKVAAFNNVRGVKAHNGFIHDSTSYFRTRILLSSSRRERKKHHLHFTILRSSICW